jgi:hypothetical protein
MKFWQHFHRFSGQQVSLWLDVHNKSAKKAKEDPAKSIVSFHEAMEAR